MDYEYYTNTPDIYNSEGDVNYRFEDGPAESDPVYNYSDDFYDEEIEKCAYMLKYLLLPSLSLILCSSVIPIP
jgi:hypothetical protein